jgi:hypothetical protein
MFRRIKNVYWRAAFWAALIVIPASILSWPGLGAVWDFPPEHHSMIYQVAITASFLAIVPGFILEMIRAIIFSPQGGHGMDDKSWLIPVGSFVFYFLVFLPIFRWLARRAARKQLGETPRTT